jgi:hypothetical protein
MLLAALCLACGSPAETQPLSGVTTVGGFDREYGEPFGIAERDGAIYLADGEGDRVLRIDASGTLTEFAAGFDTPSGIAFDSDGGLLVADAGSNTIKRISREGNVSLHAGMNGERGSNDGTSTAATFSSPLGIAVGPDGRVFVADTYNDRIRVIENGSVQTIAGGERGFADGIGSTAMFDTPVGIAVWQTDKLLVADAGNRRIRVVEPDGTVWTLAGSGDGGMRDGPPVAAGFVRPTAITASPTGIIYIADGNAIRAVGGRTFPYVETISGGHRGFRDGDVLTATFNRPSGITVRGDGELLIADSDNGLVRKIGYRADSAISNRTPKRYTAEEFRELQPARWPYHPPDAKRDIAGTLGEIRGTIRDESSQVWFHNGLDIAGALGETTVFVRDEKVLDPIAAENFGTLRELLRMPTIGYIHINLGREQSGRIFGDGRFIYSTDETGKLVDVRVPRGSKFKAGERVGTLNPMNHVHLIAGRPGAEMNALAALELPGVSDSITPIVESVTLFDENWTEIETNGPVSRIKLTGKTRIVAKAYDRMDGNPERRRLGLYRLSYTVFPKGGEPSAEVSWNIAFDRNPPNAAVRTAYARGSSSGPTGETTFNYIVTNRLDGDDHREGFLDAAALAAGIYTIRVFAADFFGNRASKDIQIEVIE